MVSRYEIGFILSPEANEEDSKKVLDAVAQIIKKAKGTVEKIDDWGRKPMAYPINKFKEGGYVFLTTETDGATVLAVEKRLRQMEKVLRFLSLRLDERLKKSNKLTKRWTKIDALRRRNQELRGEREGEAPEAGTEPAPAKETAHAE